MNSYVRLYDTQKVELPYIDIFTFEKQNYQIARLKTQHKKAFKFKAFYFFH